MLRFLAYRSAFEIYKLLIRPFKRTPVRWSAIVFSQEGQFAVEPTHEGRRLPSGDAKPGRPISYVCRLGLGLVPADNDALKLVGIVGRVGEVVTVYYSTVIKAESALHREGSRHLQFIDRTELAAMLPDEIASKFK